MPNTKEDRSGSGVLSAALLEHLERLDEKISSHISNAVGKTTGARQNAELVTAILNKPYIDVPDELGVVAGLKPSAVYALLQTPGFPPTFKIGRARFLATHRWLEYLEEQERAQNAELDRNGVAA